MWALRPEDDGDVDDGDVDGVCSASKYAWSTACLTALQRSSSGGKSTTPCRLPHPLGALYELRGVEGRRGPRFLASGRERAAPKGTHTHTGANHFVCEDADHLFPPETKGR